MISFWGIMVFSKSSTRYFEINYGHINFLYFLNIQCNYSHKKNISEDYIAQFYFLVFLKATMLSEKQI